MVDSAPDNHGDLATRSCTSSDRVQCAVLDPSLSPWYVHGRDRCFGQGNRTQDVGLHSKDHSLRLSFRVASYVRWHGA
jgi:hypothetical protein